MSSITISIQLNEDEGFVSQECPECARRFKITADKLQNSPPRYCPYCDHSGERWWTRDQEAYLSKIAEVEIEAMMTKELDKSLRNIPGFKISKSPARHQRQPVPPLEPSEGFKEFAFPCCAFSIKHDGLSESLFCLDCGVQVSTS